jgi:hypothetical protein
MSALNSTSTATATHARARKPARKREKEKRGEGKRGRRRVTRAAYLSPFPAWASKGKDAMVCAVCVRTADWKPRGSRSEAEEGALLRRCHPGQRLEEILRGEYSTSKSKQAHGQNAGSQSFFLPACFPGKAARERGSTTRGCSRHEAEAGGTDLHRRRVQRVSMVRLAAVPQLLHCPRRVLAADQSVHLRRLEVVLRRRRHVPCACT